MRRRSRRALAAALVASSIGLAAVASAQHEAPDREPIRIQLDPANRCFTADQLFAEIQSRTARVRRAGSEPARTLVVSVTSEGREVVGRIALADEARQTEPRVVRASTCAEALSGLALIAALSIEPDGSSCRVLFAPGAFVDLAADTPSFFAPELRLAGTRTMGRVVTTAEGTGSPLWLTLDLSFCPVRTRGVALSACADVEAGSLHVNATGQSTASPSRPWLAPGVEGRLASPSISILPGADLVLDLELGLRAPVTRDTFYFLDNPNNLEIYGAPALLAHGAIDVAVRFR